MLDLRPEQLAGPESLGAAAPPADGGFLAPVWHRWHLRSMTSPADSLSDIIHVAPFTAFVPRFEELIGAATRMAVYFIHSRRWRENHDAAIKAFVGREGTVLDVFLPDLENHELMYSLEKHFDDGPLIPALVVDAYRYFARLAREFKKPAQLWLFGRYPDLFVLSVRRPRDRRDVLQQRGEEAPARVRDRHRRPVR